MMDTKFLTYPECRGNCSSLSRRFRGSSLSPCDGWRNSNVDEAQAEKGEEEGEMSGIEDTSKSESLPTSPPQTQGSEQQMAGAGTDTALESQAQEALSGAGTTNTVGNLPLRPATQETAPEGGSIVLATESQTQEASVSAEIDNAAGVNTAPLAHQMNDENPEQLSLLHEAFGDGLQPGNEDEDFLDYDDDVAKL